MFKSFLNFIIARPSLSHSLTAALAYFVLLPILSLIGHVVWWALLDLPAWLVVLIVSAWVSVLVISAFYYGREAGQREHDLKHTGVDPVTAWISSDLCYGWGWSNRRQWFTPTCTLVVLALPVFWASQALKFLVSLFG